MLEGALILVVTIVVLVLVVRKHTRRSATMEVGVKREVLKKRRRGEDPSLLATKRASSSPDGPVVPRTASLTPAPKALSRFVLL